MERTYHVDGCRPQNGEVFVFGSNLQGHHYGGAALAAYCFHGASWGVADGPTGSSYAVPTVGDPILGALPLSRIHASVQQFLAYTAANPNTRFFVTRIGCGIAGHRDADIAPMFRTAPANCSLPDTWAMFLQDWSESIIDLIHGIKLRADAIQFAADDDFLREQHLDGYYAMRAHGRQP